MAMSSLERILHVDDDTDIQTVTKLALEEIGGFVVEICSSGREAIDKAPIFAPDLILLDVMMPGMDGPETLRRLRKLPEMAETPVVFMTAKAQAREIERYKAMGAVDIVAKPFDPMTLSQEIRDIWQSYRGM